MRLYDVDQDRGGQLIDSGQVEESNPKDKFKKMKEKLAEINFS